MMKHHDLFCAEPVGIGLVKLTVYGKDPVTKEARRGAAEIILDEDELNELIYSLQEAARAKITISR